MSVDEAALQRYLLKCELQYRAEHSQKAACLGWLAPHCGSVAEIAQFLRDLGFRIKEIVDEEPWPGEKHQWVVTTSGVIVYADSEGLFGSTAESRSR